MIAALTRVFGVHNLALAEGPRPAGQSVRLADDDGEEPGDRRDPA
jgi:hypothetical protein